jgi:hypothetical protein
MLAIFWSQKGQNSFLETVNYYQETSNQFATRFIDEVDQLSVRISQNKHLCPSSFKRKRFRKCQIMDGLVSVVYQVKISGIEIIDVRDNRRRQRF